MGVNACAATRFALRTSYFVKGDDMTRALRFTGLLMGLMLLVFGTVSGVSAQGAPDLTKFGYKVAKSMDVNPDQTVTITDGDQSVLIKPGSFDNPVTFELLTGDPGTWKDAVKDRTVRAAFAFRITDKTTKALVGMAKVPVVYSYSGKDAKADDAIFNTPPSSPPAATLNATPATFADGKVMHPFGGAGVGWLVVSAPTTGATGAAPAAATASTVSPSIAAPAAATSLTIAPTARVATTASTARPAATGTGGGVAPATMPVTLPQTGAPRGANPLTSLSLLLFGSLASLVLVTGGLILRRTRRASR